MDAKVRSALDTLATTACELHEANEKRNPDYDWITPREAAALENLRSALMALDRATGAAPRQRVA